MTVTASLGAPAPPPHTARTRTPQVPLATFGTTTRTPVLGSIDATRTSAAA